MYTNNLLLKLYDVPIRYVHATPKLGEILNLLSKKALGFNAIQLNRNVSKIYQSFIEHSGT